MPGLLHHGRRPPSPVAGLLGIALAVALAGCADDTLGPDDSAASSSGSPTTTSTPFATDTPIPSPTTSSEAEPEPPEPPRAEDTAAGRRAFARFVIDSWSYALATNDASALTDLSPKSEPCEGCDDFAAELKQRKKERWYVDFPGVKVVRLPAPVSLSSEPGVYVATATMNVPRSTSYFRDGEVRNENEPHRGATFEVRMRLDGKRYSLLAFRVA